MASRRGTVGTSATRPPLQLPQVSPQSDRSSGRSGILHLSPELSQHIALLLPPVTCYSVVPRVSRAFRAAFRPPPALAAVYLRVAASSADCPKDATAIRLLHGFRSVRPLKRFERCSLSAAGADGSCVQASGAWIIGAIVECGWFIDSGLPFQDLVRDCARWLRANFGLDVAVIPQSLTMAEVQRFVPSLDFFGAALFGPYIVAYCVLKSVSETELVRRALESAVSPYELDFIGDLRSIS
ncbi:hypothetical protein HK405_001103 [Cladochytrium tenue]|nr:hypothetical protein HK405_001103 [Cladochytrium tenue]